MTENRVESSHQRSALRWTAKKPMPTRQIEVKLHSTNIKQKSSEISREEIYIILSRKK